MPYSDVLVLAFSFRKEKIKFDPIKACSIDFLQTLILSEYFIEYLFFQFLTRTLKISIIFSSKKNIFFIYFNLMRFYVTFHLKKKL